MRVFATLALILAAAFGQEQPKAGSPEAVAALATSLRGAMADSDYGALSAACQKAIETVGAHDPKAFLPVVRELAKGIRHKEIAIALVCVKTLGELKQPDSSRYLMALLSIPKSVRQDRWRLHLEAIAAAGSLRDSCSVAKLDKLLLHGQADFAVAAAKALTRWRLAELEERIKIVKGVATTLGRLEKRRPRSAMEKSSHAAVLAAVVECVRRLTGDPALGGAAAAREWVRAEEHKLKQKAKQKAKR